MIGKKETILKIDFIGNIYIQEILQPLELQYLQTFCSSVHYINADSHFLGLYDVSVNNKNLLQKNFLFDEQLNLERSIIHSAQQTDLDLFPFYRPSLSFSEKSIKFSFIDINNKEDFLHFIDYIAQNILFFYHHFFSDNCYCKFFNKDFFNFFNVHSVHGTVYFKLSDYGNMFRFTCSNDKITLQTGRYPTSIKGKSYMIQNTDTYYNIDIEKQLQSIYNNLSMIDIKKHALFEEEGTCFNFTTSDTFNKLLHFHKLNNKLEHKAKEKIHKI